MEYIAVVVVTLIIFIIYRTQKKRKVNMRYELATLALPKVKPEFQHMYSVQKSKEFLGQFHAAHPEFKLATVEDAELLMEIANSSYSDMERRFPTIDDAIEMIKSNHVFFFRQESEIIGCFAGIVHDGGYLECGCFCVAEKHKKKGFGKKILKTANAFLQKSANKLPAFFIMTNILGNYFLTALYMKMLGLTTLNDMVFVHDHIFIGNKTPEQLKLQILYSCPMPTHMTTPSIYVK